MADRARFFENRLGADHRLFDRMVAYVSKLETGGLHCANHFHCVFLIDPSGLTKGELNRVKIGLGERWRGVTRGQGLMYDCHERPDRDYLKAQGKWALDFIDCSDARQIQRFIDYVAGYFAGEKGQMLRVKPTAKARTLTMGR